MTQTSIKTIQPTDEDVEDDVFQYKRVKKGFKLMLNSLEKHD